MFVIVLASLLLMGIILFLAGLRFNSTKSIPVGLYRTSAEPVGKGDYVLFCPPETPIFLEARERGYISAGFCPGNLGQMMKRVLAVGGDVVSISDNGVSVNGTALPLSKPIHADPAGRPLPRYHSDDFVIRKNEVLLMSDASATSFDGRYFGPVHQFQIMSGLVPVFTW